MIRWPILASIKCLVITNMSHLENSSSYITAVIHSQPCSWGQSWCEVLFLGCLWGGTLQSCLYVCHTGECWQLCICQYLSTKWSILSIWVSICERWGEHWSVVLSLLISLLLSGCSSACCVFPERCNLRSQPPPSCLPLPAFACSNPRHPGSGSLSGSAWITAPGFNSNESSRFF